MIEKSNDELINDIESLIKTFKEYIKKYRPNMDIINKILIGCKKLDKILGKKND